MKLDYIPNINTHNESVVRLYGFRKEVAGDFMYLLEERLLEDFGELDLSTVDFIEARNCNLVFRLSTDDEGIHSEDNKTFYCDLSEESYQNMIQLIEPFTKKDMRAHQYLYDIDNPTDLLFCPSAS